MHESEEGHPQALAATKPCRSILRIIDTMINFCLDPL